VTDIELTEHALVNPAWHALGSSHAEFAESAGAARRYLPDVSPFCALPDAPTTDDWDALRELVGPGESAFLLREPIEIASKWELMFRLDGVQMVAGHDRGEPPDTHGTMAMEIVELTDEDVPEMLELVARTQPGPFAARTNRLGTYLGIRVDGALVAMSGERMRPPGFTEVSAVCTDERYRGRGLAAALVRAVMAGIDARGEQSMLHAASVNTNAIRLYELLGFRHTHDVIGIALRAPE
jgi:ribosomal protein S18 acetylase RimI-like enzyme